jgi:predicted MarR family transcription regulator
MKNTMDNKSELKTGLAEDRNSSVKADLTTKLQQSLVKALNKCNELREEIQILEENLTRSESDRLSELASIMRMIEALEEAPIASRADTLYLIKKVIYDALCKLNPTQSMN